MAISSTGGGETQDTGGATRVTGTTTEDLGGVTRMSAEGTDTAAGTDTVAGTDSLQGGQGNDSLAGSTGNDTIAATEGNDTLENKAGNDTIAGAERTDDEIRASLKEAGGIYADPRYEAGALEFEKTGDVTSETRDKLATEFNLPRNAIDSFIEGQKAARQMAATSATAEQTKIIGELHAVVGTEAEYGKFMEWSKENLTAPERAAYNQALDHAPEAAKVMLAGFNAKYKAAGNGAPRDLTEEARQAAAVAATGYASQAEMTADMADPRYEKDEAFRATVAAKVAVSKF